MEVSGQLHATVALPPGKELSVFIEWEAHWAPGCSEEEKTPFSLPEIVLWII